ncbi:hypothetical protein VNO77_12851 [Canavalia gladiata]|uniref:Secreted protein n=1 Tax=Canavalia gladiata TaxID=3824 RepID=A0AAN9LXU4_CANGL
MMRDHVILLVLSMLHHLIATLSINNTMLVVQMCSMLDTWPKHYKVIHPSNQQLGIDGKTSNTNVCVTHRSSQ